MAVMRARCYGKGVRRRDPGTDWTPKQQSNLQQAISAFKKHVDRLSVSAYPGLHERTGCNLPVRVQTQMPSVQALPVTVQQGLQALLHLTNRGERPR